MRIFLTFNPQVMSVISDGLPKMSLYIPRFFYKDQPRRKQYLYNIHQPNTTKVGLHPAKPPKVLRFPDNCPKSRVLSVTSVRYICSVIPFQLSLGRFL